MNQISLEEPTAQLKKLLGDKMWRMNNLYHILNKVGDRVLFQPNYGQNYMFNNLWYMNLILKARQIGFTTAIDLFILDECLFHPNMEAGIIADTKTNAEEIFRRKIEYPYSQLPEWLRRERDLKTDQQSKYKFTNNRVISVGTSMRSGKNSLMTTSEA